MTIPFVYQFPVWVTAVGAAVSLLIALELGFRLGLWRRRKGASDQGSSGEIATTAMYALLGLVLALTYAFTMGRADQRKQAVIDEANALGTAFLRASLTAEPERTELRTVLRDYAATRVISAEVSRTREKLQALIAQSLAIQSRLWPLVERIVAKGNRSAVDLAIVQSINEVIDLHTVRLTVATDRLPSAVLGMLAFIAAAAVSASGYSLGLSGGMARARMTALVLVMAAVMTVITDFDRSLDGMIRVNFQPLEDAARDMTEALAAESGSRP